MSFFKKQKPNIDDVIINVPHFVSGQFYWAAGQKAFFLFFSDFDNWNLSHTQYRILMTS